MSSKNKYQLIFIVCFFIVFSAFINISSTIYSIHKTGLEGNKKLFLAQANNISDSLELALGESVTATKAILLSPIFAEFLESENELSKDEAARIFKHYIKDFNEYFRYSTLSIVSEKSKNYYTELGFNKKIDTANDPHDIWYKLFVDSNKSFDYVMDFDEAHENRWTLFTNVRINSKDGRLLGVAGFGKDMAYLKDLVQGLESEYAVKIYFIDSADNVVLGSNTQNIKSRELIKKSSDKNFSLKEEDGVFIGSKYIEQIGWSLVVEKKNEIWELLFDLIELNVIRTLIVLVVFVGLSALIIYRKQAQLINLSHNDTLSGLLNRRGGEEKITELIKSGARGMFALMDADKFKAINDTYGHGAGDEVIKKIAHSLNKVASKGDVVFRLGGDEFGFFAQGIENPAMANALLASLFDEINKEALKAIEGTKIELSAGATFLLENDDFYSIYERADKALYESKKLQGSALSIG